MPTRRPRGGCISIPTFRADGEQNRADARLAWQSQGRLPISVAAYVNNIFDKQYAESVQLISATTLGTPFTNITAPRFWGVELGVHF